MRGAWLSGEEGNSAEAQPGKESAWEWRKRSETLCLVGVSLWLITIRSPKARNRRDEISGGQPPRARSRMEKMEIGSEGANGD